jgi:hypothetical protein
MWCINAGKPTLSACFFKCEPTSLIFDPQTELCVLVDQAPPGTCIDTPSTMTPDTTTEEPTTQKPATTTSTSTSTTTSPTTTTGKQTAKLYCFHLNDYGLQLKNLLFETAFYTKNNE